MARLPRGAARYEARPRPRALPQKEFAVDFLQIQIKLEDEVNILVEMAQNIIAQFDSALRGAVRSSMSKQAGIRGSQSLS